MGFVTLATALVVAVTTVPEVATSPLLQNGGFDRTDGWDLGAGACVSEGNPGACLRFDRAGGARQDVLVASRLRTQAAKTGPIERDTIEANGGEPTSLNPHADRSSPDSAVNALPARKSSTSSSAAQLTLTAAIDIKVSAVVADKGKLGYAFAAIYQTDEFGKLIQSHDFAQPLGTQDWQRYEYAFQVDPRTDFVSVRCGLFQASGVACFDNWTLVHGTQAKRLDEVERTTGTGRRYPTAAILCEPGMPTVGASASVKKIATILSHAGLLPLFLSAHELADPMQLRPSRYDMVVLPSGQTFPAEARLAFIQYLRGGGDFISIGGYAFNDLRRLVDDRWVSERTVTDSLLKEAMASSRSLLSNGGFDQGNEPGPWKRTSDQYCSIIDPEPNRSGSCAQVSILSPVAQPGAQYFAEVPVSPGTEYQVSGWMQTCELTGPGIAFMALYQYDAQGALLEFRDFATTRDDTDWTHCDYRFTARSETAHVQVKLGLYRTRGTARFDDIRLCDVTGTQFIPINTATGKPEDGLEVSPAQIGIFDPSFPLTRVCGFRTADGQHIVRTPIDERQALRGWAASGVIGSDRARWIPLLETVDRYGRPRGAAGAMTVNYSGFYSGSCWAYFGVENMDLFQESSSPMAGMLRAVARFMIRETYLRNLNTDHRLYCENERPTFSVVVENRGSATQRGEVCFYMHAPASADSPSLADVLSITEREVLVEPGRSATVEVVLEAMPKTAGLYKIDAELVIDDKPIDIMTTGILVGDSDLARAGTPLRFIDNYFTVDNRPTFLFGTDTYARTYQSASENPWTWFEELNAARDMGVNLYENLQYNNPGHVMTDDDWRSFLAMTQLTQRLGMTFMPGMLIGHNIAIGEKELSEQSALCRQYAEHLGKAPGLLYYINGDYQMQLDKAPGDIRALWNRWLQDRYDNVERLKEAWGDDTPNCELGRFEFPPPNSGWWDDVAAIDKLRFQVWLMRRWNGAHVAAIREIDTEHPITSEYYSIPFSGMDLPLTIGEQDVANIGFFDEPNVDLIRLPLKLRFNDLRARGKGASLGEYGVKMHPAWTPENGAKGYHLVRTEQQQKQLFVAVAHYALGLGASKIQNWCLRDAQARVFPWGIFYSNQMIPKDVAYVHRNLSFVWRHFRPTYRPSTVTICLANQLRLGNDEELGPDVAYRAIADLLALHFDFNCIDDHHLHELPKETDVLIYPSPFAMRDEDYDCLKQWVAGGGTLLVTGDFSYDADRQRTRMSRLEELAGVQWLAENYPHVQRGRGVDSRAVSPIEPLDGSTVRPCIRVKATQAEVLATAEDGHPVLMRHSVGRGRVYFFTDPAELAETEDLGAVRRSLYAFVLAAANQSPLSVTPDEPWVHVMAQPTTQGTVHVLFNTKTAEGIEPVRVSTDAGEVKLGVRNAWPALATATNDGKLIATIADGEVEIGRESISDGPGLKAILALDNQDLRASKAMLVAPFESGSLWLPERSGNFIASIGEFRAGRWTELEKASIPAGQLVLDIDADRATCLILVCESDAIDRWTPRLSRIDD